ncbi:ROK family protein [Curvibacter sp. CHRR-16]|uniref:ROK family protein n=1 Tax=Curvibacter sp. CHRR-16 TaxID=2835872 RepID=UPI001BD966C5|nr:ROK family protein [Curvibacter sp. CHRR-16]MBT0569484.1 ROK family protein [Curvibacter sp. CHRR-16]
MKKTGDLQLVKRMNRCELMRLLRLQPGLSRAQLAQASGLTKSTVSLLIRELMDDGWVTETQSHSDSDAASPPVMGRPSTPLQVDGTRRALLGVDIGVDTLRAVAVNLRGEVLASAEEALTSTQPAAACLQAAQLVRQLIDKLPHQAEQHRYTLCGIGCGVPGAIDERQGLLRFAPNLGWRNLNLLQLLRQALHTAQVPDLPVHICNEADAAALGEYEFSATHPSPLVFVACGVGVGAGIVQGELVLTGYQGMAGEIGHSILDMNGPRCSCGRQGCVEAFLGSRALAHAIEQGSSENALAQAGRYLGTVLQNLWMTLNPRTMVLGGASCIAHLALVQEATRMLGQYAEQAGMQAPDVQLTRHGLLAGAVGAAALVLYHELQPLQRLGISSTPPCT